MAPTSPSAAGEPPPLPPDRRRPRQGDWLALAAMLVLGWLAIWLNHEYDQEMFASRLPRWADYVALTVLVVPITWRREAPLGVGVAVGAVGFGLFRILEVPEGTVSAVVLFLAIHAAGAYGTPAGRRNAVRGTALVAGAIALTYGLTREAEALSIDSVIALTFTIGLNVAFYAVAWLLGDAARQQRVDAAELERRAAALAAERAKVAEQAVTEERVRIARELHDVVAHHVSVMGVQAAAARHVLDRDPSRAAEALAHVESAGREAVAELQRLVAILRSEVEEGGVPGPQPSLEDLDRMVEQARAAGMAVELRRIGRARAVPSAVALSAYRIIQEGLTNARRHSPGAAVTVVVTYLSEVIQVEIVNGTAATAGDGPGGGRGLVGMRERVAMLGGDLETGRTRGGGFRVSARLPALPVRAPDSPAGVVA